jgi:hypothetical protein
MTYASRHLGRPMRSLRASQQRNRWAADARETRERERVAK